jgi:aryl-alcohol dehydrogenase-like predicted oxidoreductase
VVIATKYTANVHDQQVEKYPNQINRSGNSVKSMMVSLEASLKKLGTTYIDVFCEYATSERRGLTRETCIGGTGLLPLRRSCRG